MGGEIAVIMTERLQALAQQGEVIGLFGSDADPVFVILPRHAAKAGSMVQRKVDGREFDVSDGVKEAGTAIDGDRAALRDILGRDEQRVFRNAADQIDRRRVLPVELAGLPVGGDCCGQRQFLPNFRGSQRRRKRREQRLAHGAGLV